MDSTEAEDPMVNKVKSVLIPVLLLLVSVLTPGGCTCTNDEVAAQDVIPCVPQHPSISTSLSPRARVQDGLRWDHSWDVLGHEHGKCNVWNAPRHRAWSSGSGAEDFDSV